MDNFVKTANNIITYIKNRYKEISINYPQNPSIIQNTKGDSYYLIRKSGNEKPVQIRLSGHGTYLRTWCDREELGNSVDRIDPFTSSNISIVFVDEDKEQEDGKKISKGLTRDCFTWEKMKMVKGKRFFEKIV